MGGLRSQILPQTGQAQPSFSNSLSSCRSPLRKRRAYLFISRILQPGTGRLSVGWGRLDAIGRRPVARGETEELYAVVVVCTIVTRFAHGRQERSRRAVRMEHTALRPPINHREA